MEIERIGSITNYNFDLNDHLIVNAAIKHLDRKRRSGDFDPIPIHSATRAIFSDYEPSEGDHAAVRWILDDRETIGQFYDPAQPAPETELIIDILDQATIDIIAGNQIAMHEPIGKLLVAKIGIQRSYTPVPYSLANIEGPLHSLSESLKTL